MKLIISSDKPPISRVAARFELSLTGAATGLRPLIEEHGGVWISPERSIERGPAQSFDYPLPKPRYTVETLPIPQEIHDGYCGGLSNQVIWPVMHHQPQHTDIRQEYFESYRHVNLCLADRIEQKYVKGDLIWILDYHQLLVPNIIRQKIPDATIGIFLHTPWPAHRFFKIIPWRQELLTGMLGADLIGFSVREYAVNFIETVRKLPFVRVEGNYVWWNGRKIKVETHPIGIDVKNFEAIGRSPEVAEKAAHIRDSAKSKFIALGVDRLDYTKGILERFLAYEQFLERNPEYHGEISFYQVALPSRTTLPAYKQIKDAVDQVAGRINSTYMTQDWVPLRYFHNFFSPTDLAAFYKAADIALVTPLFDGMNAVAQEYVAVNDGGTLILSQFAGVAAYLRSAFQVNPHFISGLSDNLSDVLNCSATEKQHRWNRIKKELKDLDSPWWAQGFMASLQSKVLTTEKPLFLLDYDGTLAPIVDNRDKAFPHPAVPDLIRGLLLAEHPVYLVSGRKICDLERLLGLTSIPAFGVHGMEEGELGGTITQAVLSEAVLQYFDHLRENAPTGAGLYLEDKKLTLAMHYRECPNDEEAISQMTQWVGSIPPGIELIWGKKVLEIRPHGYSKGYAVEKIVEEHPDKIPIYIGDDTTDEDAFRTLGPRSITIKVGPEETFARFRVTSIEEVVRYLGQYL
jgi:trehalose 6-phosphate synthase/phosphatase